VNDAAQSSPEQAIRAAWQSKDFDAATTLALNAYGAEIMGLLVGMHRNRTEAEDAFSLFTERLYTTMGRFELRCSMRTWCYTLARRASSDVRRSEGPRQRRQVPLSQTSFVNELVARVRTQTASMFGQDNRDAIARLRDELPEEDRMLLVLRVDRELEWRDLASIFLSEEDAGGEEHVKREAARLRKRFQLVKERLLATGRERGLLK
jgi:RNA polymerase sigma-70 factor, ECF subfamily